MKKTKIVRYCLMAVILGLAFIVCSKYDRVAQVQAFESIHNSHDVENLANLMAQDARIEWDGQAYTGMQKIRDLAQYDSVLNSQFTFSDIKAEGNMATFTATETNEALKLAGIDQLDYDSCSIIFDKDLIKEIKMTLTPQSRTMLDSAMDSIMSWAQQKVTEVSGMMQADMNAETANKWLEILTKWHQEREMMAADTMKVPKK